MRPCQRLASDHLRPLESAGSDIARHQDRIADRKGVHPSVDEPDRRGGDADRGGGRGSQGAYHRRVDVRDGDLKDLLQDGRPGEGPNDQANRFVLIEQSFGHMLLLCSLSKGDGAGYDDILNGAASGKVADRFGEPLKNRAVRFCARQALNKLIADVARLEIGEDQGVRLSGDLGVRRFGCGDGRDDRSVELQFAFNRQGRVLLANDLRRFGDFFNQVTACRAEGGVAEHADFRLHSQEGGTACR